MDLSTLEAEIFSLNCLHFLWYFIIFRNIPIITAPTPQLVNLEYLFDKIYVFVKKNLNGKTGLVFKTFKLKNAFSYFIEEVPSVDPRLYQSYTTYKYLYFCVCTRYIVLCVCVSTSLPNGVPFVSAAVGGMAQIQTKQYYSKFLVQIGSIVGYDLSLFRIKMFMLQKFAYLWCMIISCGFFVVHFTIKLGGFSDSKRKANI